MKDEELEFLVNLLNLNICRQPTMLPPYGTQDLAQLRHLRSKLEEMRETDEV